MPFDLLPFPRPYVTPRRFPRRAFDLAAPIGWHGFKPAAPAAPYSRPTGHPSPAAQTRSQVRSPFGFTQGVATAHGAVLLKLPKQDKEPTTPAGTAIAEALARVLKARAKREARRVAQ